MPLGPAVKLTDDGSSASTVMETVSSHTVSIFYPLGAIEQVMARALNEVEDQVSGFGSHVRQRRG